MLTPKIAVDLGQVLITSSVTRSQVELTAPELEMKPDLPRRELKHSRSGAEFGEFLAEVDATGGWPLGYLYVRFYHGIDDRWCMFSCDPLNRNPEYWTTVCTADDYYWWKLSAKRRERERNKALHDGLQRFLWTIPRE